MPKRSFTDSLYTLFQAGRFYYRREVLGAALVVVGLWLLWGVLLPAESVHWLTLLVGWTAPLVATAILLLGGVLWLGRQAGYWSAEALLGAEALLFGLITFSYVRDHDAVNWDAYFEAGGGGLVGWGLGNLLIGALGAPLAVLLAVGVSVVGAALLVRYTPLIYVAAAVVRGAPGVYRRLARRLAGERRVVDQPLPQTPNFVAARPRGEAPAVPVPAVPVPAVPVPAAQPTPLRQQPPPPPAKAPKKSARAPRPAGHLPPLDLLRTDTAPSGNRDVTALQQLIVETLEDFNVPVRVVHVESGPTVTQFGVEPLYVESAGQKRKVRVSRIVSLADDLALALAAPAVRIEAPVPGRSYVGVEVPNLDKTLVTLRGILEETDLNKAGILALPLGRNTAGTAVTMDLTRAPHMLIAGATGSGKSVCINTLVAGLLMQHGPENLRFVMVDPKMVELPGYNGIPHLYGKVITATDQVMGALTWLLIQMDDRYQLFRDLGVRNIDSYNEAMRAQKGGQTLPYIVLVIDELADLMMTAAEDIERQICRLAQMARATGIHLILATQRPSTDVITGLIKANFPSRIAFAVTSQIDSRVILDAPGAERLLGRGDLLLMRPDVGKLQRIQGCFVADEEISQIVQFWKGVAGSEPRPVVTPWAGLLDPLDQEEELLQDAIDALRELRTCSTSMLQRKLNLGYPKAARLMEELEKNGVVGPDLGAGRGREVLLKRKDAAAFDPLDE